MRTGEPRTVAAQMDSRIAWLEGRSPLDKMVSVFSRTSLLTWVGPARRMQAGLFLGFGGGLVMKRRSTGGFESSTMLLPFADGSHSCREEEYSPHFYAPFFPRAA
jgi:hypothetical protein